MHLIPELLEIGIMTRVIALGIGAGQRDLDFLESETRLIVRSIVMLNLVLPILGLTILSLLPLPDYVRIGTALVVLSPVAPFVPHRRVTLTGCSELVFWLSASSAVLSMLTVPLWLGAASSLFIQDALLARQAVMRLMTVLFVLPLGIGLLLRSLVPSSIRSRSGLLVVLADLLMVGALFPLALDIVPDVTALAPRLVPVFIALSVIALLVGHRGARAREQNRRALAVLCVGRHPALALLIAIENFADDRVLVVALAFQSIGAIAALVYVLQRRRSASVPASVPSSVEP